MPIKPTIEEAQRRLRIDAETELVTDLATALEGAFDEMLTFLDRDAIYEDATAMAVAVASAQAVLDAAIAACDVAEATGDAAAIAAAREVVLTATAALDRVKTGMVIKADLITAQLLLADVAVGSNTLQDRESKQTAAENIMRRHRKPGC